MHMYECIFKTVYVDDFVGGGEGGGRGDSNNSCVCVVCQKSPVLTIMTGPEIR